MSMRFVLWGASALLFLAAWGEMAKTEALVQTLRRLAVQPCVQVVRPYTPPPRPERQKWTRPRWGHPARASASD